MAGTQAVTDPDLLAQLNAPDEATSGPVTDPDLLAQLNADEAPAEAIPVTPRMRALAAEPPKKPDRSQAFTPTGEPAYPFEDESFSSTAKRRGQQVAAGAADSTAAGAEGVSIANRIRNRELQRSSQEVQADFPKEQAELKEIIAENEGKSDWESKARVNAAKMRLSQVEGQMQMAGNLEEQAASELAIPMEKTPGFMLADWIRSETEDLVGKPDARDQSLAGQVATGAGSMVGLVAASAVGGVAGGPIGAAFAGGSAGASMAASEMYKEAIKAGATPEEAEKAAKWGFMIGSAEVVPVLTALKFIPSALKVKATNIIVKKVAEIAMNSGEEAAQEYLSTVAKNLKGFPDKKWNEGAAESALVGAILGGGLGTVGAVTSGSEKPKVQALPEKGPDAAQEEALKTATDAPPPPAAEPAPAGNTAEATVTPAETPTPAPEPEPEPDKSGVTVGETAPDVTMAVTEASNEPPVDAGPQRPAPGAPPAAIIDYIKQKAAFLEAQKAKQAQATPDTGAPPVSPDTAQAPEGPQVGGAPAAPPNQTGEALPPAVEPTPTQTTAPSDAGGSASPVTPPVTPEVTPEVTPPVAEAPPAEPPKERKYTGLSKPVLLSAAGFTNAEISTMSKKGMARTTSLIRSRVELDTGEQLEYLDPTERKAAIAKAWSEIKQEQEEAAAKREADLAEAKASVAAEPALPPKAQAAVEVSKARGGRKPKAEVEAEAAAAEAARKEEERKARVAAYLEEKRKEAEAAGAAPVESAPEVTPEVTPEAPPAKKPRVLKGVDEESLRKEAEAKVATEDRDAKISEQMAKQDAKAAAPEAPVEVTNNVSAAERVRRVSNKRTADDIIATPENDTSPREDAFEKPGKLGDVARKTLHERAKRMVAAAVKLMTPDADNKAIPSKLYMSADEDLAPNAAIMLLHEAQRLANKENPTQKDFVDFRTNEVLLRAGMIDQYRESRKVEGDAKSKPQPTQTNKDGETVDAVDRIASKEIAPDKALELKEDGDSESLEPEQKPITQERPKVTSESNPGYTVGAKKEGEVKVETKPKRRTIPKDKVRGDTGNIALKRAVKNHVKVTTVAEAMDRLDPGTIKLMGDKLTQRIIGVVLGRIRDAIPDIPVIIITQAEMDAVTGDTNTGGFYNPNSTKYGPDGAIFVSEKYAPNGRVRAHLLAHEGLHAMFAKAIEFDAKLKERITELADKVRANLGDVEAERHYGLTVDPDTGRVDPHEFISEALSEPEFQEILRDMELTNAEFNKFGVKIDPALKTESTVWTALKDMVRQYVLKMSNTFFSGQRGYTVLDAVMQTSDTLDVIGSEIRGAEGKAANLPSDVAEVYYSKRKDNHVDNMIKLGVKPAAAKRAAKIVRESFPDGKISDEDFALIAQAFMETPKADKPRNYWNELLAGKIPRKTAIEINNYLKAEVGKSIDPATVDLLIQDAIETFGKKDTSESNSGNGGIEPPYREPPSPGMGPADPAQPPASYFKGKRDGVISSWFRRAILKTMTLDFMRQKYSKYFGAGKDNALERFVRAIQKRDNIADKFAEPLERAALEFEFLAQANPKVAMEFAEIAFEASRLNVALGAGADNTHLGKNAAKGLQGKKKLAALNARFDKLSPEVQALYRKLTKLYRDAHNENVESLAYNIIAEVRSQQEEAFASGDAPSPTINTGNTMELMKRVVTGKLTEADAIIIDNPTVFNALKRATELKLINGDYFPMMRFGDYVVTSRESLDNPNWKFVDSKSGKSKTKAIKVTTEVIDTTYEKGSKNPVANNAIRVTFDPDERGARTAVLRKLRDYASDQDLKLQGISTKYRDRQTGKIVSSKGDQMVDREYDMVYEARFQTEGVHLFESKSEAYDFQERNGSLNTSQVMERHQLDMKEHIKGSQLGVIINMVNKAGKDKDGNVVKGPNAAMRKQMANILENAVLTQMAGNRAQKRYLKRQDVRGASKDMARATFTYARAAGAYNATLNTAPDIRNAVADMAEVAKQRYTDDAAVLSELINEIYAREESVVNPHHQMKFTRDIATLSYFDKLLSPAYSLINGMQPIGTTMPILAGRYGLHDAADALQEAYTKMGFADTLWGGIKNTVVGVKDIRKTMLDTTDLIGSARKKLGKEYEALMDELEERGAVSSDTGLEVGAVIEQGRGMWGRALHKVDRAGRQMPNAIEAVNRIATAVATYDLAIKSGKSKQQAIEEAFTTTLNTQGDYRGSNSPNWMKTPGLGWALQFKKYALLQAHLMGDMVHRATQSDSKAERIVARKQLMYYMGTQATMAGAFGLPGVEIIKAGFIVAGMLGGAGWEDEEEYLRNKVEEATGETIGSVINNGLLSTVTGLDFASRLSLSDLVIGRSPMATDSDGIKAYAANFLFGAPGATVVDWITGTQELLKANSQDAREKAISKLIPFKTIADGVAGWRAYQKGEVSAGGFAANTFGIRTLDQAETGRERGAKKRESTRADAEVKALYADMYDALDRRDPAARRAAERNIREYNRRIRKENPRGRTIGIGGVLNSWRRRKMEKRKSANGS